MSATRPANDRFSGYVTVAERIGEFYELYPAGRIITSIVEHDTERGFILMHAAVYRSHDDAQPAATGHAYEIKGDGPVNQKAYIENCETGCVGRALQNLGLETKRSGQTRPTGTPNAKQAPVANSAPAKQANAPMATDEQKTQIGELWTQLKQAGVFADDWAIQKDLKDHTDASSRSELSELVARAYISSLQRLLRDASQSADKRAQ